MRAAERSEHDLPAEIQALLDETSGLSIALQEWLAHGIAAIVQAVKHQLALLAAPPQRRLLPPPDPPGEDGIDHEPDDDISRSR